MQNILLVFLLLQSYAIAQSGRVAYVVPSGDQPQQMDPSTVWYDNFDTDRRYLEPAPKSRAMRFSSREKLGTGGRSMECFYAKGERGIGGRKVVFGDAPIGTPERAGESFDEIYWRYYVKYQYGWDGGGEAKHSRAIVFTGPRWTQASILHVWTAGNQLTLDPVRAVTNGRVISTKYNDFEHFKWLGNSPKGRFSFHSDAETGRWVCIEARWRLNTPGKADGVSQLWVDGELDAERRNMNFRGTYDERGINAVFLESYWNAGSPVDQFRWIDNFVVSTGRIGPITVPRDPTVSPRLSPQATHWQLEMVEQASGAAVWRSNGIEASRSLTVGKEFGKFLGSLSGHSQLCAGSVYLCRVRESIGDTRTTTTWSPLHWPVRVADSN